MVESEGHAWADRGQGHTAFLIIKLGWETAKQTKVKADGEVRGKEKREIVEMKGDCQLPSNGEWKRNTEMC